MPHPLRILILCTGNSCRSQMAEGFFRHFGGGRIDAYSAGLTPKGVHPTAIAVMREAGVDISHHTSDPLAKYLDQSFDYVITVCDNAAANCPIFPGAGKKLHWPFDDPDKAAGSPEQVLAEFRRVRDQIAARISTFVGELNLAEPK